MKSQKRSTQLTLSLLLPLSRCLATARSAASSGRSSRRRCAARAALCSCRREVRGGIGLHVSWLCCLRACLRCPSVPASSRHAALCLPLSPSSSCRRQVADLPAARSRVTRPHGCVGQCRPAAASVPRRFRRPSDTRPRSLLRLPLLQWWSRRCCRSCRTRCRLSTCCPPGACPPPTCPASRRPPRRGCAGVQGLAGVRCAPGMPCS